MHPLIFSLLLAFVAGLPSSPAGVEAGPLPPQVPAPSLPTYTCEELLNEAQDGSAEPLRLAENEAHPPFSISLRSPERTIIVEINVEQDSFCVNNLNQVLVFRLKSGKNSQIYSLHNQGPDNCEGRYILKLGEGRNLDQTLKKLRENDVIRIFVNSPDGMIFQDMSEENRQKLKKMLTCL